MLNLSCDVVQQAPERSPAACRRRVANEDAEPFRLLLDVGQECLSGLLQHQARVLGIECCRDPAEELLHLPVDDHGVQALLAAEVLVDDRLGYLRALGDLFDRRRLVTLLCEEDATHVEQLLPALLAGHPHARRRAATGAAWLFFARQLGA